MYKLFISALIILFGSGCANRVPPTGGPKDEIPPTLLGSIPKNGNTNVSSTEITLLFDELVTTKNIKKELLITPRIDFDYEYKIKKNSVILTLEEPLDSATTYTFNFRNSIVDITESNPALDLVVAFSTGPILDTLQLSGNINDLFTEKPVEKLIVGLYKINDTLNLFNTPPYYLAQTDKNGDYLFRNIKPAEYVINAFADSNNNLICESDREPYAFTNSTYSLDSNMVADTLKLQSLNIDSLLLKRARNSGQYFIAVASKYLVDIKLKPVNDSTLWYSLDEERKEIKVFNTFNIKDSLMTELIMVDSLNTQVKDTFYLKFPSSERKYDDYESKLDELEVFPETKKISFTIATSKPSRFVYTDSIRIKADTLALLKFDSTWNIQKNASSTEFKFSNYLPQSYLDSIQTSSKTNPSSGTIKGRNKNLNQEKNQEAKPTANSKVNNSLNLSYSLKIPFGSFQSVEADSSALIETSLKPKYAKDFGILMGTITTEYTHYFIQLLDKNYIVIDEIPQGEEYKFRHVNPGDYLIRIMIDSDKNGKWDAGNILLNKMPEPVLIYKNEDGNSKTTIRANWEISLNLIF